MYAETCLSVSRIENGFLIEVCVPRDTSDGMDWYGSHDKVFSVATPEEAAEKIKELLPLLADKISADAEFSQVFSEVTES